MFDKDNILRSPRDFVTDRDNLAPLRLVLEEPHRTRWTKLLITTIICAILVVLAGVVVWVWGYPTQKHNPGFWQVSLVSVLFWLSMTQGMVALSALLRIFHASWRYPLLRILDMASLFGVGGIVVLPFLVAARREIYSLGSSSYQDNVWRVAGPTTWDAVAVGVAYLAGWMLLYLTSLPDFVVLRDRADEGSKEARFYRRISGWALPCFVRREAPASSSRSGLCLEHISWNGADHQWRVMRRAEGMLVVAVIATFVASQTVLGWDFQLAAARNWDSSIFAPLYTIGSLLGGCAMLVLIATLVERLLGYKCFICTQHYDNLGRCMIALGLIWFYFRWCDFLTAWYGHIPSEWYLQGNRVSAFPILAAIMVLGCFVAPVFGNMFHRIRCSPWGLCAVSVCVLIGIAVQRYLDTVPTFAPNYPLTALIPSRPSVVIFLGLAALFVLTYLVAARYFPIMSWWGLSKERTRTAERTLGNTTVTVMVEDPPVWET